MCQLWALHVVVKRVFLHLFVNMHITLKGDVHLTLPLGDVYLTLLLGVMPLDFYQDL